MSVVGRPPNGSRLVRPGAAHPNQALSRLVHELNASRIDEESDEDEGERTGMTAEAEHPDRMQPRSSQQHYRAMSPLDRSARHMHNQQMSSLDDLDEPEDSLAQSRRQKAARTVKRKTRRLLHLLSYYISRFMHDLSSTAVTYRSLQFGIY
ncbi:hypothetical protein GGF44_000033 [Coemansia sp. RSA 1694]|nr:hypothetical protein GGF44_000033 [Coemansia sp. RSA 1694]